MTRKIILQLLFFITILIISLIIYKKYFKTEIQKTYQEEPTVAPEKLKSSGIIENLKYEAEDVEGNKYTIISKFGGFDDEQSELIRMKDVTATINFIDSDEINITAKNAIYNNLNYNTKFSEHVLITYANQSIKSDNLDRWEKKNGILQDIFFQG